MKLGTKIVTQFALAAAVTTALPLTSAHAVTGFQWTNIEATPEGAILTVAFFGAGQNYPIDLSLSGTRVATVTPTGPGEMKIPIDYKALGINPGLGGTLYGKWQQCGHQWGIGGRPSGNNLVLPKEAPPPIAPASLWRKRAVAIGLNKESIEPRARAAATERAGETGMTPEAFVVASVAPRPVARPAVAPAPAAAPAGVDPQMRALQALRARMVPSKAAEPVVGKVKSGRTARK